MYLPSDSNHDPNLFKNAPMSNQKREGVPLVPGRLDILIIMGKKLIITS